MSLSYRQREVVLANMDTFSVVVSNQMNNEDLEIILAPYLRVLSGREYEAVCMIVMNRFSYAQAANLMGVKRSVVAEYVRRAKQKWEAVKNNDRINTRGIRNVSC